MDIFDRIRNGWKLVMESFAVIRVNKSLLIFPILSAASMVLVTLSFIGANRALFIPGITNYYNSDPVVAWMTVFIFYFINYLVIVFFNVALVYCTQKIINGGKATIKEGIFFSFTRLHSILTWALISATVGVLLKNLENKHNILSGIVRGIFGVLWSLATFFIIPVMVYENLGVFKSIERSIWLIKNSWGESVSATFTFHIIGALVCLPFVFLVFALHSFVAIILFVLAVLLITCVFSTAETIFVALAYQYATNMPVKGFENVEFKKIFDILPN